MNINKTFLGGYLTRDPELRYTPKGTAVCQGGIGLNRTWKDESGQEKTETCFVYWTSWGRTAEVMSQHLKKGSPVFLEGRLKLDRWEDKQTGQPKQKLSVVVESFQFIPTGEGKHTQAQPAPARAPAAAPSDNDGQPAVDDEDRVPF